MEWPLKAWWKIATALVFCSATGMAAYAQEASEKVTVFAPYVVKKTTKDRVTTISVSRDVSYQDIDLTASDGQAALEARVRQAAQDVCRELDRRFITSAYVTVSSNKSCVKDAQAEAMVQVRNVVAAAKS
jgi:UrcA family protein